MAPLSIEAAAGWRIVPALEGGPTIPTPVIVSADEETLLFAQGPHLEQSAVNFIGKKQGGQAGRHEVEVGETFDTASLRDNSMKPESAGFIVTGI